MKKNITTFMTAILLIISWIGLLFWGRVAPTAFMPYSDVLEAMRPQFGTWQRSVNDFFQYTWAKEFLSFLGIGINMIFVGYAIYRFRDKRNELMVVLLYLAFSNLVFFLVFLLLTLYMPAGGELSFLKPLGQYRPGYEFTYKYILADVIILLIWILVQIKITILLKAPPKD